MSILFQDIILDQGAFHKASQDFEQLSSDLTILNDKINTMLNTLEVGFNTPAGHTFCRSCRENLMRPIEDQALVIAHISNVLNTAKKDYESVFTAYQDFNDSIQF